MFISIFSGGAHVLSSVYNHLLLSNLTFEAIWKAWSASSTSSAAAGREATSHSCLVSQPFNGAFSFFFWTVAILNIYISVCSYQGRSGSQAVWTTLI
jgi:hypothetical protein